MAVLKKQLHMSAKGSWAEREDWWWLCYDTEARAFHVEHEWDHMNAYKLGEPSDKGTACQSVEGYGGPGSDRVEEAKAILLAEASHDA